MLQSNEGTTTTESTCCNKDPMQQKRKKEKFIKRKWTARRTAIKQTLIWGFPVGSMAKNLPAMQETLRLIPRLGGSLGEGNGNSFQYSCRENPMDRGAWWAILHGVAKGQTGPSDIHTHTHTHGLRQECKPWEWLSIKMKRH